MIPSVVKLLDDGRTLDLQAQDDDIIQVEFSKEVGVKGKHKLYIHVNGVTILRMCKVTLNQVTIIPAE